MVRLGGVTCRGLPAGLSVETRLRCLGGQGLIGWPVARVDLIGLVMQEEPVVYVSENIPKMKELKDRPTRKMDVFETEGLAELADGKGSTSAARETRFESSARSKPAKHA